jgi:hypothetical protein
MTANCASSRSFRASPVPPLQKGGRFLSTLTYEFEYDFHYQLVKRKKRGAPFPAASKRGARLEGGQGVHSSAV